MDHLKNNLKVYIIHVRGNTERKKHIMEQIKGKNFDYEFILEGNMEDIDEQLLETYFCGDMCKVKPATSCAIKHLKAYERILEDDIPFALILEDDIEFLSNFRQIFEESLKEIKENNLKSIFVSYEDSNLKYVKGSEKQKNKILYKKDKGRLAGAYGVDKLAAKAMIEYIKTNKYELPIDWFHNKCASENLIDIYWSDPAIARQASLNGHLPSLIAGKRKGNLKRKISFNLQKIYKKILYRFR